jgi:NAD(P)-dependent dehydrogenase (short-subunit alcohol dehydrogenase family)
MGRLQGKVAVVTGAASGLGEATCSRFADEGATVVGLDLTDPAASPAAARMASTGRVDVTDEDAAAAAFDTVVADHGQIDVLATFAGVAGGGPVHGVDAGEWARVIAVNLTGTFLSCKHALRHMIERRSGSIVTVASVEGIEGTEGGSAYNASKGGVVLLTKNMAIDYGRLGVRVNCVCPGFIDTPMFRSVMGSETMAEYRDVYRERHKLGRFGRPEEIASAAAFLASEDASFITGHALVVDGGYTAGMRTGLSDLMGLS